MERQNLVNMFTNAQNQQQHHGSVVEEYNDGTPDPNTQIQRYQKRPPLLLPGPMSNNTQGLQPGSATTQPNSARESVSPPDDGSKRGSTSSAPPESANPMSATTSSPQVKTEAPTPNVVNQMPESNDQMMDLINSVNATQASTPSTAAPSFDFNSIVDQYQNRQGNPLTQQQMDNTLANIMRQSGDSSNANALTSPAPNLDFNKLKHSNDQLEMLQNMQKQQAEKVQELSQRLQPLSPTGTIPGLHDLSSMNQDPFDLTGAPGDYDPNAFINFDDNSWDPNNPADNGDFDFGFDTSGNDGTNWATNFDGNGDGGDMFGSNTDPTNGGLAPQDAAAGEGGRVESVSSEATSPAATATGQEYGEEPETPNKKMRRS